MKVQVHYTIDGYIDTYILEGNSIYEIKNKNNKEMKKRGLEAEKNNMYSIEID